MTQLRLYEPPLAGDEDDEVDEDEPGPGCPLVIDGLPTAIAVLIIGAAMLAGALGAMCAAV